MVNGEYDSGNEFLPSHLGEGLGGEVNYVDLCVYPDTASLVGTSCGKSYCYLLNEQTYLVQNR